jgi:hypothetical protein
MNRTDVMQNAMMKLRIAADQLNEMNAFSVEFDEGIDFVVEHLNKMITYLSARKQIEGEKVA